MRLVLMSFSRALLSQLHIKMLMLTILPFIASVLIWGVILWYGLQPAIDWLQAFFTEKDIFRTVSGTLDWLGLDAIKTLLVPIIALWVLLPLMVLTALLFVGTLAMPAIVRHVSLRHYAELERRKGGSFWGSLWISSISFIVFILLWIVTLPLTVVPPFTFIIQPLLWGWLTYRVMAYDALADHATEIERKEVLRLHRWRLWLIGAIGGTLGAAPTLLWLGGAFVVVLFPLMAGISIWLYVLVFVFTGLWFEHYCLEALAQYRLGTLQQEAQITQAIKDIN
ncbi:EI24 domain-containing protein [Oxalobacteraceae bacterium R-40]|uniref:EI24 domain-containing protein n=1 Tax=Keguizhuia sedimenti TaxID=3064264 RepID=A0ABU1BRJ6_9BURK|nr:EI24 domain-containing protein [Oxalobacteraceae bacterium R-40]